jgi:hypothetical protein
VIVYFEHFLGNYKSSPHFLGYSFPQSGYELILAKNGLRYILGDFFSQKHLATLLIT